MIEVKLTKGSLQGVPATEEMLSVMTLRYRGKFYRLVEGMTAKTIQHYIARSGRS